MIANPRFKSGYSEPDETIQTEGQKQLKDLIHKQLNKSVTIEEHFKNKKQFSGGKSFKPLITELTGITNLSEYSEISRKDLYQQELKQCGLSDEEINLKLRYDNKNEPSTSCSRPKKPHLHIDPEVLEHKLKAIDGKISEWNENLKKDVQFTGKRGLSRHEMDLERSLTQHKSDSMRILTNLVTEKIVQPATHPDDPLNHMPEILSDMMKHSRRARRKNRRQKYDAEKLKCNLECCNSDSETQISELQGCMTKEEWLASDNFDSSMSNTDVPETTGVKNTEECDESEKSEKCVPFVSNEFIQQNRLTRDEIIAIPKFENYDKGAESEVLYVKNLSHKVKQEDLLSIFVRFQRPGEPKIEVQLMTGRMRGQSFIKFPNVDDASEALEFANGFNLKGKPIIIQFGRNKKH